MATARAEMAELEDLEQEAHALARRLPVEIPKFRLERVQVATLNVDYAPPHGGGYARPLSQGRLQRLRRDWDPLAVSPLMISRRNDNTLWVIDGNHRRVIAYERGMSTLPAMVLSGLSREKEADLYTKLGTVLGQTPSTRFQAKLVSGDAAAVAIHNIVENADLELDLSGGRHRDGTIQAIARVEWIYARGGAVALEWVLALLVDAYEGDRGSLGERVLEGSFGFWLRYVDQVDRKVLVERMRGAGLLALDDRASSIFRRYVTTPGNSIGHALADLYNANLPARAKRLPPWQDKVLGPAIQTWNNLRFSERHVQHAQRSPDDPAPQHLNAAS